jgi:hypothetical protein
MSVPVLCSLDKTIDDSNDRPAGRSIKFVVYFVVTVLEKSHNYPHPITSSGQSILLRLVFYKIAETAININKNRLHFSVVFYMIIDFVSKACHSLQNFFRR